MSTKHIVFAIPGDIDTPTGGYIYDRRIIDGLRALGWQVDLVGLGEGFPFPGQATLAYAKKVLNDVCASSLLVIDGLALGVMPEIVTELAKSHTVIGLVHHPLALEAGLSPAQSAALRASETLALAHIVHVIVTSPATARTLMQDFGVEASKVSVVLPGTDRIVIQRKSYAAQTTLRLLSVGSVVPRKGFDILIPTLAALKDLDWHLRIAGDCTRDLEAASQLKRDIDRFSLGDRVQLLGAVSAQTLEELYQSADLFVLASRYEGYGMAYAEALAHGLPVVGTTGGAIPDTVPLTAGLLVEPGNLDALTSALRQVMTDASLRTQLSSGALRVAREQPDWPESTALFSRVLHTVLN